MKNILILGANGNIARFVRSELANDSQINLLLTSRKENENVTSLDVLDQNALTKYMETHPIDIVYANLGVHGQQAQATKNIIAAMDANNIKRLIYIATIGIYGEIAQDKQAQAYEIFGDPQDPTSYFGEQAVAANLIEASDLDYTIIRPNALTDEDALNEVVEQTDKETIKAGGPISRKAVAHWISELILKPEQHLHESIALSGK